MLVSNKFRIAGQVQGVGFRPHVYNLARRLGLKGYVSNDEKGVIIHVEGTEEEVERFYRELIEKPPPISRIRSHVQEISEVENLEEFRIVPSRKQGRLNLQLTPDFGICESCRKEIKDPQNRRFGYPFTTCVNCGPRWSLTRDFPFERENTSLAEFNMCKACQEEYTDPADRRFHSQTNSCAHCGIKIGLYDARGNRVELDESELFPRMAKLISDGRILTIKNTSGYLLCCDACDPEAIKRLRKRKKRPTKPFALMYPDLDRLEQELNINELQREALLSVPRPIVIIPFEEYRGRLALKEIAPGLKQLGVMLPYSGVLELLAQELAGPIVATSGNLHGSPILSGESEAMSLLENVADFFVHHDLPIVNPQDDSVIKFSGKGSQKIFFRRSRGYAPNFFDFQSSSKRTTMAMGSQLKSTLAYLPNSFLYQSQYLGNLESFEVYERFQKTVEGFVRIFESEPDCILVDSHPEYLSTIAGKEYAARIGVPCPDIQHHKAHFASVLAEHRLFEANERVLGIIWDGTGYGTDDQIWGGEFFIYEDREMRRWDHFEYFDWIAGDKMAREPRLSLLSLSNSAMKDLMAEKFSGEELRIYRTLLRKNKLKTSSVGRLFDASASLLGICDYNDYEGQAAILLENQVGSYEFEHCRSLWKNQQDRLTSPSKMIRRLFESKQQGFGIDELARDFLFSLASTIKMQTERSGLKKVAFSGGVFQNSILVDMIRYLMESEFDLYFNVNLAPNDENIAHGQMMYHLNEVDSKKDSD